MSSADVVIIDEILEVSGNGSSPEDNSPTLAVAVHRDEDGPHLGSPD
jgi:hypothetical protein